MAFRRHRFLDTLGGRRFVLRKRQGGEVPRWRLPLAFDRLEQGFASHALVQEFEARLLTLRPFTLAVKDTQDGFRDWEKFFDRHPLVKHVRGRGLGAEAACHEQLEAWFALLVHGWQDPEVMHDAERCVFVGA